MTMMTMALKVNVVNSIKIEIQVYIHNSRLTENEDKLVLGGLGMGLEFWKLKIITILLLCSIM